MNLYIALGTTAFVIVFLFFFYRIARKSYEADVNKEVLKDVKEAKEIESDIAKSTPSEQLDRMLDRIKK